MKNRVIVFFVFAALVLGACALIFIYREISDETTSQVAPCLNNGNKWRLGYFQDGPRRLYPQSLMALIDGLARLGWLEPVDWGNFPEQVDAEQIWRFLSEYAASDYLEFCGEFFGDAQWDRRKRDQNRQWVIEALRGPGRVDLVIAMGSWSVQDLAVSAQTVPVVVINSFNPAAAGILRADFSPNLPHVYVGYEPDIMIRQVRIFHMLCNFKRLGVVYDRNDLDGGWGSLPDLRRLASREGFDVDIVEATLHGVPLRLARQHLLQAYRELAPRVDAMWLTSDMINQPAMAKELLSPFFEHKVPTWTPLGANAVRNGVMFSASRSEATYGLNNARIVARILNGASPGDLIGAVRNEYEMVVNHAAARRIGFDMPPGLHMAIEKSYLSITKERENVREE